MDLSKAKSVVIVMLVAFNIFLLFNNLSYSRGQGVQKETIKNAAAILKARGVTLEIGIPNNSKDAHRLVFGNKKLDRAAIAAKLLGGSYEADSDSQKYVHTDKTLAFSSDTSFVFTDGKPSSKVDVNNADKVKKVARAFLKDNGLLNGKYIVDGLKRGQDGSVAVTFIENYKGFLVYDNYCTITVTAKGVTQLGYGKMQIIGFSPVKVEDLAAAYQVLLANFKEDSRQVITNMDIGYKFSGESSIEGMESVELLPVWRVKIKGAAEPVYLNTYDVENEASGGENGSSGL
jgi:regulatory protein YycI of two-component signal transduction system YycFG